MVFLGSQFPNALFIHTALGYLEIGPGTSVVGSSHMIISPSKARGDLPEGPSTQGPALFSRLHSRLGVGALILLGKGWGSGLKQAWAEPKQYCVFTMTPFPWVWHEDSVKTTSRRSPSIMCLIDHRAWCAPWHESVCAI